MPVIKSAIKKLRRDVARTKSNDMVRAELRDTMRKVRKGTVGVPEAYSVVDKSVKLNIVHKNKGARLKSSISRALPNPVKKSAKTQSSKGQKKPSSRSKAAASQA